MHTCTWVTHIYFEVIKLPRWGNGFMHLLMYSQNQRQTRKGRFRIAVSAHIHPLQPVLTVVSGTFTTFCHESSPQNMFMYLMCRMTSNSCVQAAANSKHDGVMTEGKKQCKACVSFQGEMSRKGGNSSNMLRCLCMQHGLKTQESMCIWQYAWVHQFPT